MSKKKLDRRTVLRRAAAGAGAIGVGTATTSAAEKTGDASPATVRAGLASVGVTTNPFETDDLQQRLPGELVGGAEGAATLGTLVVTQRRVDGGLLRTFHDPTTDTAHAVLDRGSSRLVIADGVREITAASTCANECEPNDCGFGEEHVELIYEQDSSGDCIVTDYDCGC